MALAFPNIDPVAVHLGPLAIRWYSLAYIAGILLGWWYVAKEHAKKPIPNLSKEALDDMIMWAVVGVVGGGRLGYVLFYKPGYYLSDPLQILRVWEGGMSFHGGCLGVIIAFILFARKYNIRFFQLIDVIACATPIGLGLGRLGNFIGGELWGRHTDAPWGMIFPRALESLGKSREELYQMYLAGQLSHEARHPSQLYEFTLEGIVMFSVLWFYSRKPRPRYAVSGLFALMYGSFRFLVEFVREPDAQLGFIAFDWLTMGQILSLPLIAVGLLLLWLSRRAPTPYPPHAGAAAAEAPSIKEAA